MSEKRTIDTGILLGLLFLLLGYRIDSRLLLVSAAFLFISLFFPALLTPLAYAWLKLGELLGFITNKIFFGLVFFLVITPIGVVRRVFLGAKPYTEFGTDIDSAFIERDHVWKKEDMAAPY